MGWMTEIQFLLGVGICLFSTVLRLPLGITTPMVTGAPSSEVKQLGHEADHSPPFSAKVKNVWIYISTPPYVLMAW
jgi:hypothetical protein